MRVVSCLISPAATFPIRRFRITDCLSDRMEGIRRNDGPRADFCPNSGFGRCIVGRTWRGQPSGETRTWGKRRRRLAGSNIEIRRSEQIALLLSFRGGSVSCTKALEGSRAPGLRGSARAGCVALLSSGSSSARFLGRRAIAQGERWAS
jgi:hypothetical protein